MPRGLVAMARSGGHCPLRVSGGILCSERGQSRDAFKAIRLEETSPRCNNRQEVILAKVAKIKSSRIKDGSHDIYLETIKTGALTCTYFSSMGHIVL